MKTVDLRTPLKDLEVGDQVITSKGFSFEKTRDGFKDLTSGLHWFYSVQEDLNHYESMEKYSAGDRRLPTREEFEEAERHGFREVLEIDSGWFWSLSVHPNFAYSAYYFNGSDGGIYYGYRDSYYAALCVGR